MKRKEIRKAMGREGKVWEKDMLKEEKENIIRGKRKIIKRKGREIKEKGIIYLSTYPSIQLILSLHSSLSVPPSVCLPSRSRAACAGQGCEAES